MILKRIRAWAAVAACLVVFGSPAFAEIHDYVHASGGVSITGVPYVGRTLTANGVPAGSTCAWIQGGTTQSTSCTTYTLTASTPYTFQYTPPGTTVYTAISIAGSCSTTATQGSAYSGCTGIAASNGSGSYTYALSGSWPSGISISGTTVSGTPTTPGTYSNLSITATDSVGGSASITPFSLTVTSVALSLTGTPPSTGTVGTAYSFTPTASGGTAPYTFAESGSLPPGVTFSTSTGALSGTPSTAGTYSGLSISVTDSASHTAQLAANPFTITVASSGGSPGLDFSQAANSQYLAVF